MSDIRTQTLIAALAHTRRLLKGMSDDMQKNITTGQFSEDPLEFHRSRVVAFMDSSVVGLEHAIAELVLVREAEDG